MGCARNTVLIHSENLKILPTICFSCLYCTLHSVKRRCGALCNKDSFETTAVIKIVDLWIVVSVAIYSPVFTMTI